MTGTKQMKIWGVHGEHVEELRRSAALCPVVWCNRWWFWMKLFFSPMAHQSVVGFTFILRHTTLDRTILDGWSARCSYFNLTTYNTRDIYMPLAGFEPTIPASERPQAHALDRAATAVISRLFIVHVPWQLMQEVWKVCKFVLYQTTRRQTPKSAYRSF